MNKRKQMPDEIGKMAQKLAELVNDMDKKKAQEKQNTKKS